MTRQPPPGPGTHPASRHPVAPHPDYPAWLDAEWVAIDRAGCVAVFTTASEGPMPVRYLAEPGTLRALTAAIDALPVTTEAIPAPWTEYGAPASFVPKPLPDSWEAFARRGCFVYDWSDVHRVRDRLGAYELMARPAVPRPFVPGDWPESLRALLLAMRSEALAFGAARTLDVTGLGVALGIAGGMRGHAAG